MHQDHYFTAKPAAASRPATAHLALPGHELDLLTDHGVFAYGHIDRGTELLLRTIPSPPASGDLLDLGCGYGPIAIAIALRSRACQVWAVDVNERALALCTENARAAGADNVRVATPDEMPGSVRLTALYSNPPVRVGKAVLHDVLASGLGRLEPAAHAYLVVQRNLGADSLARWLREEGWAAERIRSRMGYRILDVHTAPQSIHH